MREIARICAYCGAAFTVRGIYPGSNDGNYCTHACYGASKVRPWEESFWRFVDKVGACWLWTGSIHRAGYGLYSSRQLTPKTHAAHRLAWHLSGRPLPKGTFLLHTCPGGSNPRCVNPAHLALGTAAENAADRAREGRTARGDRMRHTNRRRGEAHHATTLTADQVRQLRRRRDAGESLQSLADRYGVRRETVWRIAARQTWQHV